MAGIEITGRFLVRRFVPGDQLVRISLAVKFNLRTRVQPFGQRENVSSFRRRVFVSWGGFAMESDSPQLSLCKERPAATAGDGTIGISQSSEFTDR